MAKIASSWNDFDLLERAILGHTDNSVISPEESAASERVPIDSEVHGMWRPYPIETVGKASTQLDYLVKVLQGNGVVVDRPASLQWNQATVTPDLRTGSGFTQMSLRDILLIIDNEIMASANSFRCRYFEYLAYWDLIGQHLEEDPEFKQTQAPQPRLADKSYKHSYYDERIMVEERLERTTARDFVTTKVEPMWDAANAMRLGRDLFIQHGLATNRKAMEWFKRYCPDLRVHTVNFPGDPYPVHINATFVPLRSGLVVNNPQRRLFEEQRKIFGVSDWQIVNTAQPAHKTSSPLRYPSVWLSISCLVFDHKTVIYEASEVHQMEQMDKLGMNIIPVPFRDAYSFSGGSHCATVDVYREGGKKDYFPNQVEDPTLVWPCVHDEDGLHVFARGPPLCFQRAADRRLWHTAPYLVCADWFWASRVETQTRDLKRGRTMSNE